MLFEWGYKILFEWGYKMLFLRGQGGECVKLASQLYILPSLRIIGSLPTRLQMLSWRVQTALPFRYINHRLPFSQCFSTYESLSYSEWVAKQLPGRPYLLPPPALTSALKTVHFMNVITCCTILAISAWPPCYDTHFWLPGLPACHREIIVWSKQNYHLLRRSYLTVDKIMSIWKLPRKTRSNSNLG
jgi:hypothetical protein